jgi:catechol 2,3-dioxygenase-like lactoylglutathione lyase family enzyme
MMFDHVQIKVADLKSSRPFYEAIFKSLGYDVVLEFEEIVVGFGNNPHDMFEIRQADESAPISKATHITFIAKDKDAVQNFHSTALTHGGVDNGGPGLRPEYEPGYYSAFVIDPNGHNLEAVFKTT